MLVYGIRRILLSIPVLFTVLLITFTLGFYGPGDPISIFFGEDYEPDPVIIARLMHVHGLDRPYWVQFGDYVRKLMKGDWGKSIRTRQPIWRTIKASMPISAQLGVAAAVLMTVVGIPMGVLAAARQNTWVDYWIISVSIMVRSVPVFVLGPMMMIVLVLWLDIMKTPVGWSGLFSQKAILPVFLMAAGPLLVVVRQTRTGVLEVVGQNYVRTARAKGLRERMVVSRHIIKNALTPVLTSMGLIVSGLITGALFVELIFGIPGFAGIGINAFQTRDYPLILAGTIIGAVITIFANLIVDLFYGVVDPRVRLD